MGGRGEREGPERSRVTSKCCIRLKCIYEILHTALICLSIAATESSMTPRFLAKGDGATA